MSTSSLNMDSGSATADTRTLTGAPSKAGSLKTGLTSSPDIDHDDKVDTAKPPSAAAATPTHGVPHGGLEGMRLMLVFLAMMLSVFVSRRHVAYLTTDVRA